MSHRQTRITSSVLALALAASTAHAADHLITVDAQGEFSPKVLNINGGDTVTWLLHDTRDSVIPIPTANVGWPAFCEQDAPFDLSDPNEFTGPALVGASGVFVMGPKNDSLFDNNLACLDPLDPLDLVAQAGGEFLCRTSHLQSKTMDSTWESDDIGGVFIRLTWKDIDHGPDYVGPRYDFAALDAEMDRAVANGKPFSLSVRAGVHGTPDWVYDTVDRLEFTHSEGDGPNMTMGLPDVLDPQYVEFYNEMLVALADEVKSKRAWYRYLAYVKISGANNETAENVLPHGCDVDGAFPCNDEVWAGANYTPLKLYAFYASQALAIKEAFPGKSVAYMLIQDGFPLANDLGYKGRDAEGNPQLYDHDGKTIGTIELGFSEQTENVILGLQEILGPWLVVQHAGLKRGPAAAYIPHASVGGINGQCKYYEAAPEGKVLVGGPVYDYAGSGCPNRWVLEAGYSTRDLGADSYDSLTGFQIGSPGSSLNVVDQWLSGIEQAFSNAYHNSDAVFVEVYEDVLWVSDRTNGGVMDPTSGLTIGDWNDRFTDRRIAPWSSSDMLPYPTWHRHTFEYTQPIAADGTAEYQLHPYINVTKCGDGPGQQIGMIIVEPAVPPPGGMELWWPFALPDADGGGTPDILETFLGTDLADPNDDW